MRTERVLYRRLKKMLMVQKILFLNRPDILGIDLGSPVVSNENMTISTFFLLDVFLRTFSRF